MDMIHSCVKPSSALLLCISPRCSPEDARENEPGNDLGYSQRNLSSGCLVRSAWFWCVCVCVFARACRSRFLSRLLSLRYRSVPSPILSTCFYYSTCLDFELGIETRCQAAESSNSHTETRRAVESRRRLFVAPFLTREHSWTYQRREKRKAREAVNFPPCRASQLFLFWKERGGVTWRPGLSSRRWPLHAISELRPGYLTWEGSRDPSLLALSPCHNANGNHHQPFWVWVQYLSLFCFFPFPFPFVSFFADRLFWLSPPCSTFLRYSTSSL